VAALTLGKVESVDDRFELQRFVDAQGGGGVYERAVRELRGGRKQSHWIWFVFPQIAGLGHSAMARRFAISDIEEAKSYLSHPILGPRLVACADLLAALGESDPIAVFGPTDAQKLQSSMTLFARADPAQGAFQKVLEQYFGGEADAGTTHRL
jgi:uncharacterized protein (DUF1810 family)